MSEHSEQDFFEGFAALLELSEPQALGNDQLEKCTQDAERLLDMLARLPSSSSAPIPMIGNDTAVGERSELRAAIASWRVTQQRDRLCATASELLKRLTKGSAP